jgi:hypothetical protein
MELTQLFKEWEKFETPIGEINVPLDDYYIIQIQESLGLFFWERGGKYFVKEFSVSKSEIKQHEISENKQDWYFKNLITTAKFQSKEAVAFCGEARDFLDALECLGEEKIKDLIKKITL